MFSRLVQFVTYVEARPPAATTPDCTLPHVLKCIVVPAALLCYARHTRGALVCSCFVACGVHLLAAGLR